MVQLELKLNKMVHSISEEKIERYSRNIILPEIGGKGQEKLLKSKVLVIGAGGLGSPVIMYLAAAGVGNITILDHDKVELSNLQRQIIHKLHSLGKDKATSAKIFINELNPDINVADMNMKFDEFNAKKLILEHDIIADGSDNFDTRYLVADMCFNYKKTLVSAAINKYEGQISTWKGNGKNLPCYRCLFPEKPNSEEYLNCSSNGVLGSLAGFLGSLQATEVVKEILGIGKSLSGYLNIYDLLNNNFRKIKVDRDPSCKFCNT